MSDVEVMPDVALQIEGRLGIITLNRPKALNALTVEMAEFLGATLADWAVNPAVQAVLIRGAGERAFCAGGDVRALGAIAAPEGRRAAARRFFQAEYGLNYRINQFPKPYVALINGVAMGGGMGLSIHGSHRVVSETLRMAMPETVLGLFPDVGATWFLSNTLGALGRYLALVGPHLDAADALAVGLATHHVPAADFSALTADLATAPQLDKAVVDDIIAAHARPAEGGTLAAHSEIDSVFGKDDLNAVLACLDAKAPTSAWAEQAQATLRRAAPTSLLVTWRRMLDGPGQSIGRVLEDDYRLGVRMAGAHDFAEGVRAILVDKDQQPRWQPADLGDVTSAQIDALFAPMADGLRLT
nr:enoyl-CoA hydratase/isomerase family protein [uncultured Acidocella sp.]